MRRHAGFALTGAALWRGSEFVATPDEERLYGALGLPFIPPELREGQRRDGGGRAGPASAPAGEPATSRDSSTATRITPTARTSVEELALACRAAGYQYVGITDHSQAAAYAGGLKPDDLRRQADEIDEVNARTRGHPGPQGRRGRHPRTTAGSTSRTQVLARLDFVIASIHSRFNMSRRGDDRAHAGRDGQPVPHDHRPSHRPSAALARPVRPRPRRGDREGRGDRRGAGDQRRPAPARPRLARAPRVREAGVDDLHRRRRAQHPGTIGNVEYGVGDGAEGLARSRPTSSTPGRSTSFTALARRRARRG